MARNFQININRAFIEESMNKHNIMDKVGFYANHESDVMYSAYTIKTTTDEALKDTRIPEEFKLVHAARTDFDFIPELTGILYSVIITAIPIFLRECKKDTKNYSDGVVLRVQSINGKLLFAATMRLDKEADEGMQGGWELDMTFNEDDIDDKLPIKDSTDIVFHKAVAGVARLRNCGFFSDQYMDDCIRWVFELLADALDASAKEGETYTIEIPEVFTSSVVIENGEKVKSIVASQELRQILKDDSKLPIDIK